MPPIGPVGPVGEIDSAAATQFRQAAVALLARFNPPAIVVAPPPPMSGGTISDAFAAALAATTPSIAFPAKLNEVLNLGPQPVPQSGVPEPVRLAPYFPQPMVEPLVDIAQNLVLPGLDTVLPNTVVPLETNVHSSTHTWSGSTPRWVASCCGGSRQT